LARGGHDAAHVVRAGRLQRLHRHPEVVGGHHRVAVDAGHDRVRGGRDRGVEPGGGAAGGVVHHDHPRVGRGQRVGDLPGAVLGGADAEHDLHVARVVLGEHVPHGGLEVALLVQYGHDNGYGGPAHRAPHGSPGVVPYGWTV